MRCKNCANTLNLSTSSTATTGNAVAGGTLVALANSNVMTSLNSTSDEDSSEDDVETSESVVMMEESSSEVVTSHSPQKHVQLESESRAGKRLASHLPLQPLRPNCVALMTSYKRVTDFESLDNELLSAELTSLPTVFGVF